jgi:hypothetical protein
MALEIQVLAWDRHNNLAVFNLLIGLLLSDNRISNDNTDINTQSNILAILVSTTKVNNSIRMDSTIAGSMNTDY